MIPPEKLRLWVGPFSDSELFISSGRETVAMMRSLGELRPTDSVLDVGCGSGRVAIALTDYLAPEGKYTGFDTSLECIRWCQDSIATSHPNFRFTYMDVKNDSYHPEAALSAGSARFPCESASIDVALASSIFTHLLPQDFAAYMLELARVIRSGGRAMISFLLMNDASRAAIDAGTTIFDMRHRLGPCVTFSPGEPTEGLAYDEEFALAELGTAGFQIEQVKYGSWREIRSYEVEHDWIIVRKTS